LANQEMLCFDGGLMKVAMRRGVREATTIT